MYILFRMSVLLRTLRLRFALSVFDSTAILIAFAFSDQSYEQAISLYTKAIELNPFVAVYYGNRSFAYLKTECFGYALVDATTAIELDSNYVKGYYRRAASNMSLGKFKLALKDYETVTKARPSDKDAKSKFVECNKIVKKMAFEKAISVEENKKNIADSINLDAMSKRFLPSALFIPNVM